MNMEEATRAPGVEGFLDEAGPERLRGWVWSPERPDDPAFVTVLERGNVIARTAATIFRGDLAGAGKRGGYCGFEIPFPLSPGPFTLQVAFAETQADAIVLAGNIRGREPDRSGHPARLVATGGVSGWLDRADGDEINGWCHGPEPFGAPVGLQLVEEGRLVAVTTADRWRNDLEDARQGDGRCGFRFTLPDELYDGAEHVLDLQLASGERLASAPIRIVMPASPPERAPTTVPRRPASTATPILSIIVNFYDMRREAARTLHSLSRAFQRDVEDIAYEVLCVDNGSKLTPLDEDFVAAFGPEFRLFHPSVIRPSPCAALNEAAAEAKGRWIAVMIDGAHLLSPGALSEAHIALQASPGAIVALRQWFVGGDQRWFSTVGYSREQEDLLFARIEWPDAPYKIFDISSPMYESPNSWFDGMSESNCLFLPADLYRRLGGFDEAFDTPGAGFANLDLFRRAADQADAVISLLGEASFHQYHGGMTTNVEDAEKDSRVRAYASQYAQMRGADFASVPFDRMRVSGRIRIGSAMIARQRPPAPLRQGLSDKLRPRPLAIQFDDQAQRYLQSAYVETGRHHATRWRGHEIGLAPTDLFDLQEALWRARPEVVVMKDTAFPLVDFVASLLEPLGLGGTRIAWVGGDDTGETAPPAVRRIIGDAYAAAVLAAIEAEIGAAEHVMVLFGSRSDDTLPIEGLARYGALVTQGSYMVVPGVAFGQPWIGYSRRWTYRAIIRFVQAHPAFVIDHTLNQHLVTTSPSGFLRRALDPPSAQQYDPALDDLSGL